MVKRPIGHFLLALPYVEQGEELCLSQAGLIMPKTLSKLPVCSAVRCGRTR
jgi:hypothetical protein